MTSLQRKVRDCSYISGYRADHPEVKTGLIRHLSAASQRAKILSISRGGEDTPALHTIFRRTQWSPYNRNECEIVSRATFGAALPVLRERKVAIVIYNDDIRRGSWQEASAQVQNLSEAPLFILTSLQADEEMWAESLNLGVFDVLVRPFQAGEVIRIVNAAWSHWSQRQSSAFTRGQQILSNQASSPA